MEKIKQAAIKDAYGAIWTLPKPCRHPDILLNMTEQRRGSSLGSVQGFITEEGRFVTREEAFVIARKAHQLVPSRFARPIEPGAQLFSEDLW